MKIRKHIISILFLSVPFLFSCSKTNQAEEAEADIIAAQMEGREAARIFVNRQWKDTTELHRMLLEARSRRTKYDTIGYVKSAAAYDSAFVSTIRTVNPDIARQIEK